MQDIYLGFHISIFKIRKLKREYYTKYNIHKIKENIIQVLKNDLQVYALFGGQSMIFATEIN